MKRLIAVGFIALTVALAPVSRAQYTGNNQTNIISGVTSNWSGDYYVGSNTFADVLLIQNGGVFSNTWAVLGLLSGSSNNAAVVTGSGSVWSNSQGLTVGYDGAGNELVVSNGGRIVASQLFWIGGETISSSNNSAVVDGDGSLLTTGQGFSIGILRISNSLAVRHGGHVISGVGLPALPSLGN